MTSLQIPPFPYKRQFMNPDELWQNARTKDLVTAQVITLPDDMTSWRSIPRGFKWDFQGRIMAFVTSDSSYDSVNKLVDYFSEPARMKAFRQGRQSPYDYYMTHYPQIFAQAQKYLQEEIAKGGPVHPLEHWVREAIYLNGKGLECTHFKIAVSKAIFKYFGSRVVLDGSAGWGDRLLGAAAAGVQVYHGVDPNPHLKGPYDEMLSFVKERDPSLQYSFLLEDFLLVDLVPESYDTFFSSPPFGPFEVYNPGDPKQSIHGRDNMDAWTVGFFYPYLRKAWSALVKGGYFIIYISDTKTGKYTANMHKFINEQLKGDFLGIIALTDEERSYGYPIWVWRK